MSLKDTERERLTGYHLWGNKTVGEYLGGGNFGHVYALLDEDQKAVDALKVVTIEYTEQAAKEEPDPQKYLLNGLRNTLDEIQRMMELKELEHFVSIYGYENYPIRDGTELIGYDILIWMEKLAVLPAYIEQLRQQGVPMQELDFIRMGIQICSGLEEASRLLAGENQREAEFIHRDIKPENIFVSEDGTYKLGDLGIATMSWRKQYTMIGTPRYMAPEMFCDHGYRANVDLFALGKTLEHVTKERELVSGLEQVIRCAEAAEPGDRYQTAQEMRLDLEQCLRRLTHSNPEGEPTLPNAPQTERYGRNTPTEPPTEKMTRSLPRNVRPEPLPPEIPQKKRWIAPVLTAIAVVAVGLAAFGGFSLWQDKQLAAQREAEHAEIRETAEGYVQQENYTEAILYLQDALEEEPDEEEWQTLLTQCEDRYRTSLLEQAEAAYAEEDNKAAAQVIQEGLELLRDDPQLLRYQRAYEESDPKDLQELTLLTSNSSGTDYYERETVQDIEGTEYNGCFRLMSWGGWKGIGSHSAFCTYALKGEYQWFEATYFMDRLSDEEDSIHFLVLADDAVVYDSGAVSTADSAERVRLDVTGVQELTIRSETTDYALFGINPSILVTDAVLKKAIVLE